MKALPEKYQVRTITAQCDATVTFEIEPLTNQIVSHIQGINLHENEGEKRELLCPECKKKFTREREYTYDSGGASYDIVGFGLKALSGLEGLELEFDETRVGRKFIKRVKDECINRIPKILFDEILVAIQSGNDVSEEDSEALKNTPGSSTPE